MGSESAIVQGIWGMLHQENLKKCKLPWTAFQGTFTKISPGEEQLVTLQEV